MYAALETVIDAAEQQTIEAQAKRKKQFEKELETAESVTKRSRERLSQTKESEGQEMERRGRKKVVNWLIIYRAKK